MAIEAQLHHHRRGHWSLQWQCPERNVWRVEHFYSEKEARLYTQYLSGHEWKITKRKSGRYAQIGYFHGN